MSSEMPSTSGRTASRSIAPWSSRGIRHPRRGKSVPTPSASSSSSRSWAGGGGAPIGVCCCRAGRSSALGAATGESSATISYNPLPDRRLPGGEPLWAAFELWRACASPLGRSAAPGPRLVPGRAMPKAGPERPTGYPREGSAVAWYAHQSAATPGWSENDPLPHCLPAGVIWTVPPTASRRPCLSSG